MLLRTWFYNRQFYVYQLVRKGMDTRVFPSGTICLSQAIVTLVSDQLLQFDKLHQASLVPIQPSQQTPNVF